MLRNESKLRKNADQNPTEIGQNETETDIQAGKKVEKLFRLVKLNKIPYQNGLELEWNYTELNIDQS